MGRGKAPHQVDNLWKAVLFPPEERDMSSEALLRVSIFSILSELQKRCCSGFSRFELADGSRGYFHPDNYTFGQTVYLSRIVAAAMEVSGVRWVKGDSDANPPGRFQRWGKKANTEIEDGYLPIGRFEIARLDNDANAPENGRIEFHMEGGV